MASNVQVLLQGILSDRRRALIPSGNEVNFFELFTASEFLKTYDLSVDEIEAGLIGGGNDGGIDGIYSFVDGEPLDDVSQTPNRDVNVELVLFQSKDSESFSGTALDKMISTINTAFDFGREVTSLRRLYNERLLERVDSFRKYYSQNITRIAKLNVRVYYVTRSEHVHGALQEQVATLELSASRLFPNCIFEFGFIGAPELLALARTQRPEWMELKVAEGPIVVGDTGYIALVRLSDYKAFVTDARGNRTRSLFLDNVRDYEGHSRVNDAIAGTLRGDSPEDFWTLNNGVTLLAQQVRTAYKLLALRNPKVVNGLQTTMEIFDHFKGKEALDDNRTVLVRVVVPVNEASRDRIIVATNSQTAIKPGVLKATDPVHKDIEELFAHSGLYYERRRNAYRNEGVSLEAIVTMPQLALCVVSVLLQEPHLAVKASAPTAILQNELLYQRIFSHDYPLKAFGMCVKIVRYIEAHIRQRSEDASYIAMLRGTAGRAHSRFYLWWAQWHVAMYLAAEAANSEMNASRLADLDFARVEAIDLDNSIAEVRSIFDNLRLTSRRNEYQVAKSSASTAAVLALVGHERPMTQEGRR
jgi:hypothetical protein